MKNKLKLLSCLLACALAAAPLAACRDGGESDFVYPITSETEAVTPNIPAANEEENEIPASPEEQAPMSEENETTESTEPNEPVNNPNEESVSYIAVLVDGLNVRSGAGTDYSSLGSVEKGVLLKLTEKQGDWYKTSYLNREAYVSAKPAYTTVYSMNIGGASSRVESVIEEGLKLLGTKYVYGATRYHDGNGKLLSGFTTSAFDCSSLMQYMFYKGADTNLGVTTRTQVLQGTEIPMSEIKRGDLLFFTNASRKNNTGIERVGHVALYLGNNYILHTASDYAKIEQITPTRQSYFITAKRMI